MDLDRVCIIQTDSNRWIASDNSLRPGPSQLAAIWLAFHTKTTATGSSGTGSAGTTGSGILRVGEGKERVFRITENDGTILRAVGGPAGRSDEVLWAARTRQFVILAGLALSRDRGQCREEVEHIKAHLLGCRD